MSKTYKLLSTDINDYLANIDIEGSLNNILNNYKKKIKRELIEQKYKLLLKISENENLDFSQLKLKYMTSKELMVLDEFTPSTVDETETLLNKIEIDNETYYYEQKDNGKIYNKFSIHVGYYKDNEFILTN